jgi:imidazolonepropionase-like amidohydrolase
MNWRDSILPVTLLFAFIPYSCDSTNPSPDGGEAAGRRITSSCYALVNGLIIDGTGNAPLRNGAVVIRGSLILAVGVYGRTTIPPDAEVVDVQGATILPGFINAHVHKAYDEARLRTWAWNGVTAVRDEGILSSLTLEQAIAIRDSTRKNPECARLISAGFMMTVPGGYGGLTVTSPSDARQKVFEQLDKGIDLIKFSQEDGYAGRHDLPKLSNEEMSAIITAAHERGTLVSAHITQSLFWGGVVQAGADDVAHVAYDPAPDAVLDAMVAKEILLIPTVTVFRNYNAPVSVCIDNVRRFVQKGGVVALGNDYAGGPGSFEDGIPFYELSCMLDAGMTPMQIIMACTRNAARASHVDTLLGTIEAGKAADILVVNSDPLTNLSALLNVRYVIHGGVNIRTGE